MCSVMWASAKPGTAGDEWELEMLDEATMIPTVQEAVHVGLKYHTDMAGALAIPLGTPREGEWLSANACNTDEEAAVLVF